MAPTATATATSIDTTTDSSDEGAFLAQWRQDLQVRLAKRRELVAAALATAALPQPAPFGLRVPCPLCKAQTGHQCVTRGGADAKDTHDRRIHANRQAERNRHSRLVLLADDPSFKLSAGDVLIGYPYVFGDKWTIVRRESDGFDPECNQYTTDVTWAAWA